jgi:tRNA A-37 threonylcarbamoyl transferase component Bud32
MGIHFNTKYESFKNDLLTSISDFDTYDNSFDTGKRNSIKKIETKGTTFVIKSFKKPILINQFIYKYIRKSKAKRSFEYANTLLSLGVKTPPPVAYIENFNLVGLQNSYYISEFINDNITFRTLIHEPNYPDRNNIVDGFTKFTFHLHEKGVEFLDHSPGNTLIVKKEDHYDFYLVDLNRMKFGKLSYEQRLKNFARITRNKSLIKQIATTYANLINKEPSEVFNSMWLYNQQFRKKFDTKKRFKNIVLNRK